MTSRLPIVYYSLSPAASLVLARYSTIQYGGNRPARVSVRGRKAPEGRPGAFKILEEVWALRGWEAMGYRCARQPAIAYPARWCLGSLVREDYSWVERPLYMKVVLIYSPARMETHGAVSLFEAASGKAALVDFLYGRLPSWTRQIQNVPLGRGWHCWRVRFPRASQCCFQLLEPAGCILKGEAVWALEPGRQSWWKYQGMPLPPRQYAYSMIVDTHSSKRVRLIVPDLAFIHEVPLQVPTKAIPIRKPGVRKCKTR